MILVFLRWLEILGVPESSLHFELYVHVNRQSEILAFRQWWAKEIKIPMTRLQSVYLKKGNPLTNRTNVADLYHGLLRIKVRSSTSLNRQINGWVKGIVHQ